MQLKPYHFLPPGILHPITAIYELRYGENEVGQSYPYLKNVHTQIPKSGVSEGIVSLVDGSYEYYHYLLDGIDDNASRVRLLSSLCIVAVQLQFAEATRAASPAPCPCSTSLVRRRSRDRTRRFSGFFDAIRPRLLPCCATLFCKRRAGRSAFHLLF
ncbi:hypothetical protein M5K25_003728 [Dendrobium thyrsiflorum]|uniref:Uncharacterized protein n=1 Tax=Dendrobium thyrsiflorum TaxID=117978 RepID=A0ABD0VLA8_DENTH